ncbi:BPTD_2524 family lipoprotein [Frateuria sp. GZRe12]|uniref:BPTD_2524 family lipoprotein n=1 Tax=Frateuria sp. GZRe12 TaxID=3351533 RepID=UPI003EDBDDF1
MIRGWMLVCAATAVLAACSVRPDGSNGARRDFILPGVGYAVAYHRAVEFARICHTGGGLFKHATITNELFPDTGEAYVHVAWGGGTMPEQINIKDAPDGAAVSVVNVDQGMWDGRELDAATRSLQSGIATCR